jgi:hypothetical protein
MVVRNKVSGPFKGKYFTGYASRKNHIRYVHDHETILKTFKDQIVHHHPIEDVFARAMGNFAYQFRAPDFDEVKAIVRFIQDVES